MGTRLRTEEETTPETRTVQAPFTWPRATIPAYGPRIVRLTKATQIVTTICGTLAAASALLGGLAVANQANTGKALLTEGQVITAQIRELRQSSSDSGKKFRLVYEYEFQGQKFSHRDRVKRDFYESHRVGDTVNVTFLPRKPGTARLGTVTQADVNKDAATGSAIVILLTGLFGGLAALMWGVARRESEILTNWTATSAQILEKKKAFSGQNGATAYKLKIRYRVPRQGDIEFVTKLNRNGGWSGEPGEFVDVLYDPEDPNKVRLRDALTSAEIDPSTY